MKALKLDTDGQLTELEITGSHLTAYYVAIKCDAVDVVAFEGCDMWLDDEGMYRQRPNLVATLVYQRLAGRPAPQTYFGPVVFTGGPDREGETTALSAQKAAEIRLAVKLLMSMDVVRRRLAVIADIEPGEFAYLG